MAAAGSLLWSIAPPAMGSWLTYSTKNEFPPIEQALSPIKRPVCCQNVEKKWPQLISFQTTCITKGQEHFGRGSGKMVRTRGPGCLLAYTIFLPFFKKKIRKKRYKLQEEGEGGRSENCGEELGWTWPNMLYEILKDLNSQ